MPDRVVRASLGNLANQTSMEFLVNPETLEETLEVDYERAAPIGLSHRRLQYKGTGNLTVPLELVMSDHLQQLYGHESDQYPTILEKKAWCQALCYPAGSQDYSRIGPPRVLFTWPHVVRIVARVTRWSTLHRDFSNEDLHTTVLVVRLELEEDLDTRKLMEDVIVEGSIHVAEAQL